MSMPPRPVLVLAPGMLSDEAVWGPQADAFAADFEVRVARYGEARTLAAMAEGLLEQAPARFALAAHSLGGRAPLQAAMAALLPGAPLLLIDRCGHLPTLEAPQAVTEAMRGWLAEIAPEALRSRAAVC